MNATKKLVPSKTRLFFSLVLTLLVVYAICYSLYSGNEVVLVVSILVALTLLLSVLKMPKRVEETDEYIKISQVVGETLFLKRDFEIAHYTAHAFTLRLCGISSFMNWGYFWNKPTGVFYALFVNSSNLVVLTKKTTGAKFVIDSTIS